MLDRVRARPHRLLILGGTAEAAALARAAVERFGGRLAVTRALAGRTEPPGALAGDVRIGGFGGAAGLAAYLVEAGIALLIAATHPFADRIARSARHASEELRVPRLVLERPPWRRHPLDRWIEVEDGSGAVSAGGRGGGGCVLPMGARGPRAFPAPRPMTFVASRLDPPR